jgi:fucose permease
MFVMGSGVNSWLPTYIVTANKADYLEASALLSCFWAAGTVMRGLVWKIIDKAGEKKVLVIFSLIGSISSFISLFLIGFVPNAVVWGVVGLVNVPLNPLVMAVAYSKYRRNPGRVMGRLVSFGNFGALISAPLIGVINNISGPNIATLVIPISGLVVTVMFLKLKMD